MRHNPERDIHEYRRGPGRTKKWEVMLPRVRVSTRTSLALRTMANALGISLGDAMREAISAYTGIPTDEPNETNTED